MLTRNKLYKEKNLSILFLCIAVVYFIIWSFTGQGLFKINQYNSFSLQADAWLHGRLDIEEEYTHLELAIYNGKYFVSFPPLPSVILLPFVLLFGTDTPDHLINLIFVIISSFFAFKTAKNFSLPDESALITALFYVLGSNILFLMYRGWVWFLAQNISIAFCTVSLYFSTTHKPQDSWLAFFFLALAVGSRPFQMLYFIITMYLAYLRYRTVNSELHKTERFKSFIPKFLRWCIPAALVGGIYFCYNYARFGNIFEFGHNYLPEFMNSTHGQFSLRYLWGNLGKLLKIPEIVSIGLDYPSFEGFSVFMVFPMLTLVLPVSVYRLVNKTGISHYKFYITMILLSVAVHIALLCMHRTMGGWHFGNRYISDCMPYIFLLYISLADYDSSLYNRFCLPFFIFGFMLNAVGTIIAYNGLSF